MFCCPLVFFLSQVDPINLLRCSQQLLDVRQALQVVVFRSLVSILFLFLSLHVEHSLHGVHSFTLRESAHWL